MLVVAGESRGSDGRQSILEAMPSPFPLRQMIPLASLPEAGPTGAGAGAGETADSDLQDSSDYAATDGTASVSPARTAILSGVESGAQGTAAVAGATTVSANPQHHTARRAQSRGSLAERNAPPVPPIVVLFVERLLSGLDGVSMLQAAMQDPALLALGATDPEVLQVVGMTNSPDLASSLTAAGAHQVLIKPFERSQALRALSKCIRPGETD
jgi:CheY-like chemotaxis protein